MKTFKDLSPKEKLIYIGIMAIYPLILFYGQLGKSVKFLNTRKRQITASILTVCLICTVIPLSAVTVFAATPTVAEATTTVSYAIGDAYKYTSEGGAAAVKYGRTSTLDSNAVGTINDNVVSLGTTASATPTDTNYKLIYVPVEATVSVPANTEVYLKHNIEAAATRIVAQNTATVVATTAVYYLGETDVSSSLTFYPYYSGGEKRDGVDPLEIAAAYQGLSDSTQAIFSTNADKTVGYNNTTDNVKEFKSYFGVMVVITNAQLHNNTMTCDFTFTAEESDIFRFTSANSFTLATGNGKKNWNSILEYSTDLEAWTEWDGTQISSSSDGKLFLRGKGNTYLTNTSIDGRFVLDGSEISCSGNIMTLLDYENPGTEIKRDLAFYYLFSENTALVSAPDLPATTLSGYCYQFMFNGCTSLKAAPELPATELNDYCYSHMFDGCTSLVSAPELSATTLKVGCYSNMFKGCTALKNAPKKLPAKTLEYGCYQYMFQGCTSLETAPELPATTLATCCYGGMFKYCTALKTAPALPATTLASYCYQNMFEGCTALVTAPELPAKTIAGTCYSSMFSGCTSLKTAPELPATTLAGSCYSSMFNGCTSLETAPELPATTLADYCYSAMFDGCTSLKTAPVLPATTLVNSCYSRMFSGCTSLETAPELPADTVAIYCYSRMFYGCTSLKEAPELPAATLADGCYQYMFYGCKTLESAPLELPATTLAEYCYEYMFYNCYDLIKAPKLPAKTLAKNCYQCMFGYCRSIETAPELPATELAENCYRNMFYNCDAMKQGPKTLPATVMKNYCYYGMFNYCSSLKNFPEFTATTVADYCFYHMFNYCKGIKVSETQTGNYTLPFIVTATEEATNWNTEMFKDSGGTFTGSPALNTTYYVYVYPVHFHDEAELTEWTAKSGTISTSGTYFLSEDITATGNIIIGNGTDACEVTLCLNGKTLDMGSKRIEVAENSTLTICDCSGNNSGKITSSNTYTIKAKFGNLNLLSGTVDNTNNDAIYVYDGDFNMSGGVISSVDTGLYISYCDANIYGNAKIYATNTAADTYGIYHTYDSNVNIYGDASITATSNHNNAAAIRSSSEGTINIYENASLNAECYRGGYGIYNLYATINVYGNAKINSVADFNSGYGIYLGNSGKAYVYGNAVVTCSAKEELAEAYGIYSDDYSYAYIYGNAKVSATSANDEGYALYSDGKGIYIYGTPTLSGSSADLFIKYDDNYVYAKSGAGDTYTGTDEISVAFSSAIEVSDVIINNITDSNKNKFTLVNDDYKLKQSDDDLILAYNDEIPPTGEISVGTNRWEAFLNKVTFGLFFNKYQYIEITANDEKSGVKSIQYYLSETPVSLEDIKKSDILWKTYSSKVKIEPNNKYFVYAKITDNADNVTYINTDGIVLDNIAPTFSVTVGSDTFDDNIGRYYFITGEKEQNYFVEDTLAGIQKVEYLDSENELDDAELENATGWQTLNNGDKLKYQSGTSYNRYYRAIDKSGNISYVYLGVVVCYTDYNGEAFTADYIYGSKADAAVDIELDNMQTLALAYRYISLFDKLALSDGTNNYTTADGYEFYELSGKQGFGVKLTDGKLIESILQKNNTVTSITLNVKPLVTAGTDFYGDVPSALPIKIIIKPTNGEVKITSDISKTYDGTAVSAPSYEKLGNGLVTTEYKVKGADDSTYTTVAPKNAGEYTVRVRAAAAQPYKAASATRDFTIAKATFEVTVKQNGELTYDGIAQTATVVTTPSGNDAEVSYKYGIAENACDSSAVPAFTNADTYTVYYVASCPNFNDVKGSFEVKIGKKALTVTAKDNTITYGDAPSNNGVIYDGFVLAETETVLKGTLGFEYSYAQYEDIGDNLFTITPKGLTAANYEITFKEGKLTVNPLKLEFDWNTLSPEDLVYDGNAKKIGTTVTNKVTSGQYDVWVWLEYHGDTKNVTDEGFYAQAFSAAGEKAHNYNVDDTAKSPVYKITKATPETNFPTGFNIDTGKKLSDIDLTGFDGYTWDAPDTAVKYDVHEYSMTFTPADTQNYKTVSKMIKVTGGDITAPTGEITLKDSKWTEFLNNITFGLYFKETQSIVIIADDTESGVKEIAYYLSAEELSIDDVKALESGKWTVYADAINVEPDNKYVVYARITDNAGNIVYINSDGIVLDSIKPVIAGVEDGKDVYGDAVFTVDEEYLDTVTLDGEPIEVVDGKYSVPADNKEHTIVVTDKTGNKTTYKLAVYKNYKVSFVVDGKEISSSEIGYGNDATLPEIPKKDGYTAKWDVDGKNITADTVITAVYEKMPQSPQTGDNTNIAMWAALLFVSGISVFGIGFAKKRKKETE